MVERRDDPKSARLVVAEPLSELAFAPFGEVIAHRGEPERCFFPTTFEGADGVRPHLWVNRVAQIQGGLVPLKSIERHRFSAQSFLPLRRGCWLVVVIESGAGGRPCYDRIRAFVTNAHQGVAYRPGTWHHGLLALDAGAEVAVVMGLTGRDDDTEFEDVPWPVAVRLPPP